MKGRVGSMMSRRLAMPDGIPWRVGNSGPTQFTNIGHKMVTVEQRSVRADGGVGIM